MSAATVSRARSAASRRPQTRGASASAVPRRVSGPVGGRVRAQPRTQQGLTAGARALGLVRSLPDHSLLDRLVRGRAWIPVLGVLLTGIVAMQVEILKVGTSLGRSLERTTSLQGQNESLQADVAGLAEYQRIERLATGMGMVMPSPGLLTFVAPHPQSQVHAGIANIHSPDPAGFATQLAAQMAAAELVAPSTPSASSQSSQTAGATGSSGQSPASSGTSTSSSVTSPGAAGGTTSTQPSGGTTGTGTTGTGPTGAGTTGAGTTGAGTTGTRTTGAGTTGAGTTGAGTTTGAAPTNTTVTPAAGTGTSSGAAGLPATSPSQSGSSSGG